MTVRAKQVRALGADVHRDLVVHIWQSVVRNRGHQAVRAGIEVNVTRASQPLHQHDASGDTAFERGRRSILGRIDLQILGTNAQRQPGRWPKSGSAIACELDHTPSAVKTVAPLSSSI